MKKNLLTIMVCLCAAMCSASGCTDQKKTAEASNGETGSGETRSENTNNEETRSEERGGAASDGDDVADSMFLWCGLRTETPPVPLYFLAGKESEVVYWTTPNPEDFREDPDDELFGDPSAFCSWRVQDQVRRNAGSYTQMGVPVEGRFLPIAYAGEKKNREADLMPQLTDGSTPMPGLAYRLKDAKTIEQELACDQTIFWLFTDDYLKSRQWVDPEQAISSLTPGQQRALEDWNVNYAFRGPDGLELFALSPQADGISAAYLTPGDGRRTDENMQVVGRGELRRFTMTWRYGKGYRGN